MTSMSLAGPPWRLLLLGICLLCSVRPVVCGHAKELPTTAYPLEGGLGPDTYLPDKDLTICTPPQPYPSYPPWAPNLDSAKAFCSSLPDCGGFLFTTEAASLAGGDATPQTAAGYCQPQSFTAGSGASASSAVAFVRRLYASCDVRAALTENATSYNGDWITSRTACVRLGRGLIPNARDRTPRPNAAELREPPRRRVQLSGVSYEVGVDTFTTAEKAQSVSADGTSHTMWTADGIAYYMAGSSHATRHQSERPFDLDGYYPLYLNEAGAQAASLRASGNGLAQGVGRNSALGLPEKWTRYPHDQLYYMPIQGFTLYLGDYVAPFALDGYYPLYWTAASAAKASASGAAQSHGPESSTGHPLAWSTGEVRVYYMPAAGVTQYYGNYLQAADTKKPTYTTQLQSAAPAGATSDAAAAASAIVAMQNPPNTASAAATQAAAPAASWFSR
ncbi:unnamed protein product [Polarella glacialis]|uniref:Uncharacterized protein n=1 Tax=Polarella glacialis TaxID=89957 RepID=A0A813FXI1_POLGL|nr:unnamed protein product [Polarella glacialis]